MDVETTVNKKPKYPRRKVKTMKSLERKRERANRLTIEEAVATGITLIGEDDLRVNSLNPLDYYTEDELLDGQKHNYVTKKGAKPFVFVRHINVWADVSSYRRFLEKNKLVGAASREMLLRQIRGGKRKSASKKQKRIITQRRANPKEKRHVADFYPTPGDTSQAILDFLSLPKTTVVYDPACGKGHLSKTFALNGYPTVSADLFDYGYGETGLNFLYSKFTDYDWLITNPPFTDAVEFIERAYQLKKPFAMFLKATFWNAKTRRDLFLRTKPTHVLPLTWRPNIKFLESDKSPMDGMWTVWGPRSFEPDAPLLTDFYPLKKPNRHPWFNIDGDLIKPFNQETQGDMNNDK